MPRFVNFSKEMLKRNKIIISGLVIGVFFRKFIYNHALKLGLKGYVRNLGDRVEAVFEGPEEKVQKIISLCKQGPPGAKVENIVIKTEKFKGEKDFKIFR